MKPCDSQAEPHAGPDVANSGELCGEAFGVPVRIFVEPPALRAKLADHLPHGFNHKTAERVTRNEVGSPVAPQSFVLRWDEADSVFTTHAGDEETICTTDGQEALEQLGRDLMIHVADFAPGRVFVHAGVVACGGHGLVLPGTSFAGKTTLVAELVRAGAVYYSDEYAVVDAHGLVHPYTRDLQMRRPGMAPQHGLSPASLNASVGVEPLRIRHVLFARFLSGSTWKPEPVSRGMAVLEMLTHSIPVQRTPARVMSALGAMVAGAQSWRSDRDEFSTIVPRLLEALRHGGDLA